jgi:NAD-dependent SIR2 family protein deacetylase
MTEPGQADDGMTLAVTSCREHHLRSSARSGAARTAVRCRQDLGAAVGFAHHGWVTQAVGGVRNGTAADALLDVVRGGEVVVLSGAGLSTESGIPDYRGPSGLARRADPMTYQVFVGAEQDRQRYWARSHVGWRTIRGAAPNRGHRAVAELERLGMVSGIITQNVDGLHQAAGAQEVVDLHGSLARVVCLGCSQLTSREALDRRLRQANPDWDAQVSALNPDGDAVVADAEVARFRVVDCVTCGGLLKPDVVFFGENVPRPRVADCYDMVDRADSLLVLGSSLTVMSGFRFVRHAAKLGIPVAIVNQGPTRGDALAGLTIDGPLGQTLSDLAERVGQLTG